MVEHTIAKIGGKNKKVCGEGKIEAGSLHVHSREAQGPFSGPVGEVPELREVESAPEVHGCLALPGARAGEREPSSVSVSCGVVVGVWVLDRCLSLTCP